jgi:hypothetical protein
MWRSQVANTNYLLAHRVMFVELTVANNEAEEMKQTLSETNQQLAQLKSKLKLSVKQLLIVQASSVVLEAEHSLVGYHIDCDEDIDFIGKVGNGSFGV